MGYFLFQPITNRANFGGSRPKSAIKFLVVHYTSNTSRGANADAHRRYFQNNAVYASAHYFVDDKNIIQIIGDSTIAYAVGDNQGYGRALNGATNYNSISVEMCVNSDSDLNEMHKNVVALFQALKKAYPNAQICRHYDVSRKICPQSFVKSYASYVNFLNDVKGPVHRIVDISANKSEIKILDKPQPATTHTTALPTTPPKKDPIVVYKGDGDKAIAELIGWAYRCEVVKEGTKDVSKFNVMTVGGKGADRIESAFISLKSYLPNDFKNYLNVARIKLSGFMHDQGMRKDPIVVYYADGDKAIADLIAWKYKCEAILDGEENEDKQKDKFVIYVGKGKNRIESAFEALSNYLPISYLKSNGENLDGDEYVDNRIPVVVYENSGDEPIANLIAWKYRCEAVKDSTTITPDKYIIMRIESGADRIETAAYALAKYAPEVYRKFTR